MIFGKFWRAFKAQLNKLANLLWTADPIAQLQYEADRSLEELKAGQEGLAHYRALVDKVSREVANNKATVDKLTNQAKVALQAGDRALAARYALEMKTAGKELEEHQAQQTMHEQAYNNNLAKIKHAQGKIRQLKDKITRYKAELKMSKAEADLAKLDFNMNINTEFGQIEEVIQDKIGQNRAKARVAADLSGQGLDEVRQAEALQKAEADQALRELEMQMGLVSPETAKLPEEQKSLGTQTQKQG